MFMFMDKYTHTHPYTHTSIYKRSTLKKTIKRTFTEFLQAQYLSIQIQLKCLKAHLHHVSRGAPAKHEVTQSPMALWPRV